MGLGGVGGAVLVVEGMKGNVVFVASTFPFYVILGAPSSLGYRR